ncbi:hypothetical protein Tco_0006294 [Tanacetum coccineum]
MSMHGSSLYKLSPFRYSTWKSIIREVHMLKDRGVDLISHCHIRVGNGLRTQFWNEVWIGDTQLSVMFPRIYALEINKDCTVADKLQFSVTSSLHHSVRGGVESSQLAHVLQNIIEGTEEFLALVLPLPDGYENVRLVAAGESIMDPLGSYADWLTWFNSIRLSTKVKDLLEGVLYITWWSLWMFRNQLLFSSKAPRKDVIFDDIVSRSFTWCLSRCNCTFSWDSWLQHPYLISL